MNAIYIMNHIYFRTAHTSIWTSGSFIHILSRNYGNFRLIFSYRYARTGLVVSLCVRAVTAAAEADSQCLVKFTAKMFSSSVQACNQSTNRGPSNAARSIASRSELWTICHMLNYATNYGASWTQHGGSKYYHSTSWWGITYTTLNSRLRTSKHCVSLYAQTLHCQIGNIETSDVSILFIP